jgi:hypothetical protein
VNGLISSQLYQGVERILRRHATFWQTTDGKTGCIGLIAD